MYFTDKIDFLAHYGVMGMKWGVRKYKEKSHFGYRFNKKYNKLLTKIDESNKNNNEKNVIKYQRKAAKMASRKLNKNDKKIVRYQGEKEDLFSAKKRYKKQVQKYQVQKNAEKIKKYEYKIKKTDTSIKSYKKQIARGSKEAEKLLNNAKYNGVSIKELDKIRYFRTKRDFAITLISPIINAHKAIIGTEYKAAKKPKKK